MQTEELKCQAKVDKGNRTARQLQNMAEHVLRSGCDPGKTRLVKVELRQCYEMHKDNWEPTARKSEAKAEKREAVITGQQHEGTNFGTGLGQSFEFGQGARLDKMT